jgi:hypothetical protein
MRTRKLAATTIWMMAAAINPLGQGQGAMPTITLKVFVEMRLDDGTLLRTKQDAIEMFGRAGVGVIWLDCESGVADGKSQDPCQLSDRPSEFRMHLTAYKPPLTVNDMLGYADVGESAGVYYPAVVRLAAHYNVDAARIIGAAIVHEVGHLILGANAHSPRGVMRADWGKEQFALIGSGELSFAPDQARRLPVEVKRRISEGKQKAGADQQ